MTAREKAAREFIKQSSLDGLSTMTIDRKRTRTLAAGLLAALKACESARIDPRYGVGRTAGEIRTRILDAMERENGGPL